MFQLLPFFFVASGATKMNPFIVGGHHASIKKWPFMTFVEASLQTKGGETVACGGSLISSQTVLTAAHCTDDITDKKRIMHLVDFHIYMGHSTLTKATLLRNVLDYTAHEDYHPDDDEVKNDISVMFLEKPVDFSATVKKAILVKDESALYENQQLLVAGWGRINPHNNDFSQHLKSAYNKGISYKKCAELSATHIGKGLVVCTAPSQDYAYSGDSGGPLVKKDDLYQVGIVSFRDEESGVTIFTSVPGYYNWIQKTQRKMFIDNCKYEHRGNSS